MVGKHKPEMKVHESVPDHENDGVHAGEMGADRPTGDEPRLAHPEEIEGPVPGEHEIEVEAPVHEKRTVLEAFVPRHESSAPEREIKKRGPGRPKKYG